jgi:hypothetical protein
MSLPEDISRPGDLFIGAGVNARTGCPPTQVWKDVVSGSAFEDVAMEYLRHAAQCRSCADFLDEATVLSCADATPEEEALLQQLWTSSEAGQSQLAARLHDKAGETPQVVFKAIRPRRLFWFFASFSTVALLLLIAFVVYRRTPSDSRLLALAYNKQRTMELRIPGGDPVPMASITRSGDNVLHGLSEPAELLELHLRAQKHLEETPDSPYWHQVLGEIDLLHQDGVSALRNFEFAVATDNSLPNLIPDQGAAWFELGNSSGDRTDYGKAAEFYKIELNSLSDGKSHPTSAAILHYNIALCWLHQDGHRDMAVEELRSALAAEKSPAWRRAMQDEIDRLSQHSRAAASGNPLESDGYEAALDNVVMDELPLWSDPVTRAQLAQTAARGARHHDRWLSDWIASPHTALSHEADRHLSAAAHTAKSGEAETSLKEATQATALYTQAHNGPGRLRALVAQGYANQRLGRTRDCTTAATSVTSSPPAQAYALLYAHALLDLAICTGRDGRYTLAYRDTNRVLDLTTHAALPQLHMYALSMQASNLHSAGAISAAWQLDTSGLLLCEAINCNPTRRYAFLYYQVRNAQDLDLPYTAAAIMRNAVQVASASADKVTYAYALETMGSVAGHIGDFDLAERSFAEADQLAHAGHQAALSNIYQAEWRTDKAAVLVDEGKPQAALNLLQQSAGIMLASDYTPGRIKYLRQASVTYLALHRYDEALTNAQAAVDASVRALASLQSTGAREQWARENAPIFAQLVKVYLARGEQTAALETWERFRAAPYGSVTKQNVKTTSTNDARIIVLARIDGDYVGWLATPQPLRALRTVTLGPQRRLQHTATTFYRLCADRDSSVSDLHTVGAQLYASLLAPLMDGTSDTLLLDVDPSLSMLPFAALTVQSGSWLGDSFGISILPAWWSIAPSALLNVPPVTSELHFTVLNGFDTAQDATQDVSEISGLHLLFPHARILQGASPTSVVTEIQSSDLFHFTGHTSSTKLLLSPNVDTAKTLSPESLDGVHLPRCRIAVLAACNTTAADPDRIDKLPDLLAFYKQLLTGSSPRRSLQSAQMNIHSTPGWAHPFFWAAFQVFAH